MKYKALFLDVDGTTVIHGVNNLPSPKVTEAIHLAKKTGISVCLATSRTIDVVDKIIMHLDLRGYCVLSGGTQIYDTVKKKIIIEKTIPQKAVRSVLSILDHYDEEIKIFDGVREYKYAHEKPPKKILDFYFPKLEPSRLAEIQKKIERVPKISCHRMDAWEKGFECLDIMAEDASKLHGISEVAKLLNIQTHEMIGVGDGYNDFPLLMACGLKIAMGNAVPELKAIADFVAPTVDEDGVATVIEKFILNE